MRVPLRSPFLQAQDSIGNDSVVSTAASSHPPSEAQAQDADPSVLTELSSLIEAQWQRRKLQFMRFLSTEEDEIKEQEEEASKCHVCNVSLRLYRLRHHCRNCSLPVCGVHSKNQVPLPDKGFMKAVRVCDICTRQLVQRRAGYRSPRATMIKNKNKPCNQRKEEDLEASKTKEAQLLGPMPGVLYSCMLEEQDNTVDELLYLGTFTIGGRALASRRMSANVAIWKDRMFMLTPAEMLCFKATSTTSSTLTPTSSSGSLLNYDDTNTTTSNGNGNGSVASCSLGEVRSCIHLTDILHIEVPEEYPRILTVIRSDGRIFRIRAKTAEQCQEIHTALKQAIARFQDAMYKLQRGPVPEDNCISCVTIQHESSLPEQVVVSAPVCGAYCVVDMYPSSILRLYVNGPNANGVAMYSCETLSSSEHEEIDTREVTAQAEPLRSRPMDSNQLLHVSVRSIAMESNATPKNKSNQAFWSLVGALIAVATAMQHLKWWQLGTLTWLIALILLLNRFHEPLSLLITTRRLHRAKRLRVCCQQIVMKPKQETSSSLSSALSSDLLADEDLDPRFLEGCNGDVDEAKRRYVQTMQWRAENAIDTLLLRPAPQFSVMKETWIHCAHKKDKMGHVVTIEHLGSMKKGVEYFMANGVSEDDAIRHHIRIQEFLWQVIDPRPFPEGTQVKILDIKGISMGDLSGDVFSFMKTLGQTVALYNPERIYQVFIVNPPSWFNLIWKVVSPLINPKTRERVHVLRGQKDIAKALLELIDAENLPIEYGGMCQCEGGCLTHSPEETDLRTLVTMVNRPSSEPQEIQKAFEALKRKYQAQLPMETKTMASIPE